MSDFSVFMAQVDLFVGPNEDAVSSESTSELDLKVSSSSLSSSFDSLDCAIDLLLSPPQLLLLLLRGLMIVLLGDDC